MAPDVLEKFGKVLKGKFESVVKGGFTSSLDGVESITLSTAEEAKTVSAIVYYKAPDGMKRSVTLSIFQDGTFSGYLPGGFPATRDEIAREILEIVEKVDMEFWEGTDIAVTPDVDPGEPSESTTASEKGTERDPDPSRLELLRKRPDVLFGFYNRSEGMKGYHGCVFPGGIVLESPDMDNALYAIGFEKALEVEESVWKKPAGKRVTREQRDAILKSHWQPIVDRAYASSVARAESAGRKRPRTYTKQGLRDIGATRVFHKGEWQERVESAIEDLAERKAQ